MILSITKKRDEEGTRTINFACTQLIKVFLNGMSVFHRYVLAGDVPIFIAVQIIFFMTSKPYLLQLRQKWQQIYRCADKLLQDYRIEFLQQ